MQSNEMAADQNYFCPSLPLLEQSGEQKSEGRTVMTLSNKALWTAGILLFCFASGNALATPSYNFTLTGVNGNYLGGVYTSPYYASIKDGDGNVIGVGVAVICDDFATDSYVGQSFWATATSVASLHGGTEVKFDQGNATQQQTDYATAAFLVGEILAEDQTTLTGAHNAEVLSFALWSLFDTNPNVLGSIGGYASEASAALTFAQNHALDYTQYGDVQVWTPSPDQHVSQEFLTVGIHPPGMAEPSSVGILCIDFLAVGGLIYLVRRRMARGVSR